MTTLHLFSMRSPTMPGAPAPQWWETLLAGCRRQARRVLTPYRPERHYMRGPGPASAAKRNGGPR